MKRLKLMTLLAASLSTHLAVWAGQVHVLDLSSGEIRQVTLDDRLSCGSPHWSPDGDRIAYDAWQGDGAANNTDIYVVPREGGGPKRLGPGMIPAWSSDGSMIFFSRMGGTSTPTAVFAMNADGSGRESLLEGGFFPRVVDDHTYTAMFNMDLVRHDVVADRISHLNLGYFIAPGYSYSSIKNRYLVVSMPWNLRVVSYNEALSSWETQVLLSSKRRIGQVSWASDGRRAVVAMGDPKKDCSLYVIDVEDGTAPKPVAGLPPDWICCNPNWSPTRDEIVFVRVDPDKP